MPFTTLSQWSVGRTRPQGNFPVGVLDPSFVIGGVGFTAASENYAIAVQTDGKIIVGGSFTTWNGVARNRIIRFNVNGTVDGGFTTAIGTGPNSLVRRIVIQSDTKIIVAGDFTLWNGVTTNRVVRLENTGAVDAAFRTNNGTGASARVETIFVQSDQRIVLGGNFATWNGVASAGILRLSAAGVRDATFGTGTIGVSDIKQLAGGDLIVCGTFSNWAGVSTSKVVRLSSNGVRSAAFTTNTGINVGNFERCAVQQDDKIVLVGSFTTWNGVTTNRILRLQSDGTRDAAFTTATGTASNDLLFSVAINPIDQKIVIGGAITSFNGVGRIKIARLNPTGSLDTTFVSPFTFVAAGGGIEDIQIDENMKILATGKTATGWAGFARII